jgi:hypothetical protein
MRIVSKPQSEKQIELLAVQPVVLSFTGKPN